MFARRWWPCAGVLIGLLALPLESPGAVLTFAFEGHVTSVDRNDPSGAFPSAALGDTAVYTFSFDSNAPKESGTATYAYYRGLASSLTVRGSEFDRGVPSIEIQHPLDAFDVSAIHNPSQGGLDGYSLCFRLSDQVESNALTSVNLPLTPYPLEPFNNREFSVRFFGSGSYLTLNGIITDFYAVPEPTSLLCLLAAGAPLAKRRRRDS